MGKKGKKRMRRLFSKIATLSVGLAMAIGVGVAIGASQKATSPVIAATENYSESFNFSALDGKISGDYGVKAGDYWKVPDAPEGTAVVTLPLGKAYAPTTNISVTLHLATFGSGDTPSGENTTISAVGTDVGSTWSGSGVSAYPSSSTFVNSVLTITNPNDSSTISGLAITISVGSGVKIFRLDNVTIAFSYQGKDLNHITASVTNPSNWYAGDTFRTSDVTVNPYFSEDDSDPDTPITDGTGVKFGDSADLDDVTLVQGNNSIKVNYGGKSTTVNVTAGATPVISGVVLSGDMTKKLYSVNNEWDYTGLYLTVSWTEGKADTTAQLASATYTADPAKANSPSVTTVTISGTYEGFNFQKTITGITVAFEPVTVNISGLGNQGTTRWKPTTDGSTFTDSGGNTATFNTDVKSDGVASDNSYMQYGKNTSAGTYVLISIPLSARAGVSAAGIRFSSNGGTTVECLIYGDTENDVILNASVTGNSLAEKKTTDDGVEYSTINASTLHFKIMFTVGCKLAYYSYTLGNTVQEFQTFTSLAVQTPTSDVQFKVGDTFSASGLVLRATDNVGFTKDFTSGIKFGKAENDDSYNGYKFVADDATNSPLTVYASLTIGGITKSINYQITVTEVPTYSLVSNLDDLYEGAKVLIVYGTKAAAAYGTNYLTSATVAFTGDDITNAGDAVEFTVRIYGSKVAFQFGAYYLSYSGSLNQIQRSNTLNDSCAFYNNGTGLLSNVSGRYLQHWATTPDGFACLTNGYSNANHVSLYISNKSVDNDTVRAETYAYRYLHMRDYTIGNGSCMTYYGTAKTKFGDLSAEQKAEFVKITAAVERLQAWAEANGDAFDPDSKTFTKLFVENYVKGSSANYAIIIIVATVSITALGLTLMIVKKKKHD